MATTTDLQHCIAESLEQYFEQLDGSAPVNIYQMVLSQVEAPLLQSVMAYCQGNQCKAAKALGMSRGTLRKKLADYRL